MELDLPPHREGSFDGTLQITATLSTSACLPTDEAPVLPSLAPVCRNDKCASSSSSSPSPSWKHGWLLRSGRIADLCEPCGLAYERNCFCETFHADETGWRACISCQKQVHCGCIASMLLYVLLDTGGIECVDCANKKSCASSLRMDDPSSGGWTQDKKEKLSWTSGSGPPSLITTEQGRLTHGQILSEGQYHYKTNHVADDGILGFIPAVYCAKEEDDANAMVLNKIKLEESAFPLQDASSFLLQGQRECQGVIEKDSFISENVKHLMGFEATKEGCLQQNAVNGAANSIGGMSGQVKNRQALESLCGSKGMGTVKHEPSLSLGPLGSSKQVANESCETGSTKTLLTQKFSGSSPAIQRLKQRMPKPPQAQTCAHTETPNDSLQGLGRVARPPGEGRGKNQLLPRYWPRITDQELQQISSGDSNSIITPLFEKMLSASDAGRIGRLVLPKACAEAYFPTISQAEGIPLKIQDVNGREWLFQFRFWPNNNSRMYVLEGVTPCIQSMQLQAGDIVTFSRLDPEGKLIMGCRQAPTSQSSQDPQNSNTRTLSAPTSLTPEKQSQKLKEECFPQSVVSADRKKRRTLCSKTKRLRLEVGEPSVDWDNLMWEEVQLLLQPPPKVVPTIVTIEGHDFEEYEEPPVFGTGYFSPPREGRPREEQCVHSEDCESGQNHQDNTPLQTKWTCGDSSWDSKRDASGTPMEVENGESDSKLLLTKDAPSGLEALANAAVMGENRASSSCPAPTTKHPRHRPGCTCIVCIQPPSGKGPKHKTTCICNVCMTVKRRFTTLMMRRKKRQSEQEAESARKKLVTGKEEGETNDGIELHNETNFMPEKRLIKGSLGIAISGGLTKINHLPSNGGRLSSSAAFASLHQLHHKPVVQKCVFEKAPIDLNSQPERDDEAHKDLGRVSMMMLFRSANYPLERYLQQQGIPDLSCLNQITSQTIPYPENQGELILEKNCSQSVALTSDRRENQSFDLTRKTFDNGEVGDQDLEKQGKSCVLKL